MTSAPDPRRPRPLLHPLAGARAPAPSLLIAACVVRSAQRAAGDPSTPPADASPSAPAGAAAKPRADILPTSKSMAAMPPRTTARALPTSKSGPQVFEDYDYTAPVVPPEPAALPVNPAPVQP